MTTVATPSHDRAAVAEACRGSADPAALAWLAEGLELEPHHVIVDVGGGRGGPAAWISERYGSRVLTIDPDEQAVRNAATTFGIVGVVADGHHLPVRGPVHGGLLLGVLSMSDDPVAVLGQLARITHRLGVLAWCGDVPGGLRIGPSTFPDLDALVEQHHRAGWHLTAGPEPASLPTPRPWRRIAHRAPADADERAVARAAETGRIRPHVLVASVATPGPTIGS